MGLAKASVTPPGSLGVGCSLLMAPSAGEGPPPRPGSAAGEEGISCCPGSSSPLLFHPTWQFWAPAVPRTCVSPALLGPSQLLSSQAGNIWWLSPLGGLSIWCHRWYGFDCGQCHGNVSDQAPSKLIPLPSEPGVLCHWGLKVGWKNWGRGTTLPGCS